MTTETVSPPVQIPRDKAIILDLLPEQGEWDKEEYLWLSGRTNRLVEFVDGRIEVVAMPSDRHQRIMLFLYRMLYGFLFVGGFGIVLVAPIRLRLSKTKYREPDILMLLDPNDPRREDGGWSGADLVVEIVSPDDPERDLVTKRAEYAQAGIPEYWIVDPQDEAIIVLRLEGDTYAEHGIFRRGDRATSALLNGFEVNVDETLDGA